MARYNATGKRSYEAVNSRWALFAFQQPNDNKIVALAHAIDNELGGSR